jgi:hypothetical protein
MRSCLVTIAHLQTSQGPQLTRRDMSALHLFNSEQTLTADE